MTTHLNHEQLCDLLLADRATDAWTLASPELERSREHVRDCHICADELSSLSQSLTLFRSTADAWAHHEWNNQTNQAAFVNRSLRPVPSTPRLFGLFPRLTLRPALWTAAAAVVVLAAVLPITLQRLSNSAGVPGLTATTPAGAAPTSRLATPATQSDEALLEEINQTLSSSVPTPMQPLADPTASGNNQSNNAPRKN
jgi:hypothetical protein